MYMVDPIFSTIEQKLILSIYGFELKDQRFTFKKQSIIKHNSFFTIIKRLELDGIINIINSNPDFYTLTDYGRLLAKAFKGRFSRSFSFIFLVTSD